MYRHLCLPFVMGLADQIVYFTAPLKESTCNSHYLKVEQMCRLCEISFISTQKYCKYSNIIKLSLIHFSCFYSVLLVNMKSSSCNVDFLNIYLEHLSTISVLNCLSNGRHVSTFANN